MTENDAAFARLLATWQNMSAGDRKAVERALSADQRAALDEALIAEADENAIAAVDEYRGYSPWLAKLLKANKKALQAGASVAVMTPLAQQALNDLHEALRNENVSGSGQTGFLARAKQAWDILGARQ